MDTYFASPEYGVQTFLWWRPDIAQRDLALVDEMGFGWVKQHFAWRDIETIEKGSYDWWRPDIIVGLAEDAGLKLLIRLDRQPFWTQPEGMAPQENRPPDNLADFGDFCGAVAGRYKGRIAAYQVWNEPNLRREWGEEPPDPAGYTALLQVCYEAIKLADPDAIVISAGLAPTGNQLPDALPAPEFLQGMYDAGAADYFDVLGVNAPGYKAPPELSPDEAAVSQEYGAGRWFAFRHVEDQRRIMVANGDGAKQIAVLEMGWTLDQVNPSYAWHAVSEQEQADYLVRAYEYAREHWTPWIGLMTTIYIADYDWTEADEQWWWSITLPDGSPRLAFTALSEMEK
ncbi:MAG: cellulase family glycosylhydrolase [Anaerolineales bacterium]|nr:cellulase family glycosylhydrolase [Anaerolineales bacterium]